MSWPAPSAASPLADPARERFAEVGYLTFERLLDPGVVEALRAESVGICRGERGAFLGAVAGDPSADEAEVLARYQHVYFPHKLSPLLREVLASPPLVAVAAGLIGPNVKCAQSMLFLKAPGQPGRAWHQDEHYVPTRDRSLVGVWIALDPATQETGCLWVLPGSHRRGVVWRHRAHGDPAFDPVHQAAGFPDAEEDAVAIELAPGGAVAFHGYLLHRSLPNRHPTRPRRAVSFHYASAETLLPFMGATGPIGGADCRDVVLVAGEDPLVAEGIADVVTPFAQAAARPGSLAGSGGGAS